MGFDSIELFENPYHAEDMMQSITKDPQLVGDFILLCVIKRMYNCRYAPVSKMKGGD